MSKSRKNAASNQNQNKKSPLWARVIISLFGRSEKGKDRTPSSTASSPREEAFSTPFSGNEWRDLPDGRPRIVPRQVSVDRRGSGITEQTRVTDISLAAWEVPVGGAICFEDHGMRFRVEITERTAIVDVSEHEDRDYRVIYRFAVPPAGSEEVCRGYCEAILSQSDYAMFREIRPQEKMVDAIRRFASMGESGRTAFRLRKEQSSAAKPREGKPGYTPITDENLLRALFDSCRDSYPENIRVRAEMLFRQLEDSYVSPQDRANTRLRLSQMLTVRTAALERGKKTYDEVMEILNRRIYGMEPLKMLVAEQVMLMQHCEQTACTILLTGNPGVGKTSVVKALAECFNLPMVQIDCEGADVLTLAGLSVGWASACCGKIMEAFYQMGTTQILLDLEEIDKMTTLREGENPYSALIRMLGPQKELYDRFVAESIDVSATVVVATANDPEAIPPYIRNRFQTVLHIPDYTAEDKLQIARGYMVPEVLKERKIGREELRFTDGALRLMAVDYTCDKGAREMRANLETMARKAVSGWARGLLPRPFVVDESFVRDNLLRRNEPAEKRVRGFCG